MNMQDVSLKWNDYKYFPYEKIFALEELSSICGARPHEVNGTVKVSIDPKRVDQLRNLTYFNEISYSDTSFIPTQTLLELSSLNGKNGRNGSYSLSRQNTRYSAHGLHEYRGKFNPQIVRAVGNILKINRGAWVLDPFCGSGTALLEACHIGWNCIGFDLNPLAVEISNAKIKALTSSNSTLKKSADSLLESQQSELHKYGSSVAIPAPIMRNAAGAEWLSSMPNHEYLTKWFSESVLFKTFLILEKIKEQVPVNQRIIYKIILSDLLRDVSLQDPADLRIRRRKDGNENYPVIELFLNGVAKKISVVLAAKDVLGKNEFFQRAYFCDTRSGIHQNSNELSSHGFNKFDFAITSPPYATALPYIDTQRLSLCLLGLINDKQISFYEKKLIGTREIDNLTRREFEEDIISNKSHLSEKTTTLCNEMLVYSKKKGNGFRRENMPALTYKYFSDMADAFSTVRGLMKKKGVFALVVGRNKTSLGGKDFIIETPELLVSEATQRGFIHVDTIELNAYMRYDIHRNNSIKTESLIILKKI